MKKPAFERRVVVSERTFQIWERRGGEWEKLVDNNRFRDEYGPYAR